MKTFKSLVTETVQLHEAKKPKKFDDVHIISKNITGMVYEIKGKKVVVQTSSGLVTADLSDIQIMESASQINESKANDLKKTLESSDWGMTIKGGNGAIKKKGKNLVLYDSVSIGVQERLKQFKKNWVPGGFEYNYFKKEMGITIKIVDEGFNHDSKIFRGGDVWLEVEVS